MSTTELRAHIAHRLTDISDTGFLKEIGMMLDVKMSETVFRCTAEQREAIAKAQQAIAQGEYVNDAEMKKAVELWANEN